MASETLILGVNPTFYLKKIEPLSIPSRLLHGDFKNITLSSICIEKGLNVVQEVKTIEVISNNPLSNRFTLNDRNNNTFTCVTTNNFEYNEKKLCQWCRLPFTHSWVGIPYRLEVCDNENTYYTDGCYCCTQCVAAELRERSRIRFNRYNGLYVSADVLLEHLHSQLYPNIPLISAPHFYHHVLNGGALSDKEFYGHKTPFVETNGIVLIPTKRIGISV
jgi:hypothetical protein